VNGFQIEIEADKELIRESKDLKLASDSVFLINAADIDDAYQK
jgi:hypothetical protein